MKKLLLLAWAIFGWASIWAQCQTDIDFNTWLQEGYAANGSWNVQGGGTSVFQTINGDPTFYVSPDTFLNVRINGRIRIEDNTDNDFVGFVFGYKEPDAVLNQYDFFLFDWKRQNQTKGGQYLGEEGYTLSRIQGIVQPGVANYWPSFWDHQASATCTPIATNYSFSNGWNPFTDYDFTLLYTPTRVTIIVNNDTIFDIPGCFEPGRFGFYNYSQPSVRYSDFSYNLISNYEVLFSNYDQCMQVPVSFVFTDSACTGGTPVTSNIATWDWDFGDGSIGNQTNPAHTYTIPGNYPVKLVVTDVNGCQDSVTKNVTVHPPPLPTVIADTVLCPSDSVGLLATGGITYNWSPNNGLSDPNIANPQAFPSQTTLYTVTVTDQYNCVADTQVTFFVFIATVSNDETICEEDTILLNANGGGTYLWSPSTSLDDPSLKNPQAFPLVATTYQAIVTDPFGCRDTVNQTVNVNPLPLVSVSPDTSICFGEAVSFTASGATTYQWTDAAGNNLGSGSSISLTGNTTMIVIGTGTDNNGCQVSDTVNLTVFPLPIVDAGPDFAICEYETLTLGSSSNPAGTISWSTQQFLDDSTLLQPTFTPTGPGLFPYTMTLTDLNTCTNTAQMQVSVRPFQLSVVPMDVPCFGEPTGSAAISVTGTGPFTYTWLDNGGGIVDQLSSNNSPESSNAFLAGTYQAVAIDALGCTDTIPFLIGEPATALAGSVINLQNVDCFGNNNGVLDVAASGGTPGYQYSIDGGFNFNTSGNFTGLAATIYNVLVRDANNCETIVSDTIRTPTGLFAQITTYKHIDCFGANNGAIALQGVGGQAPYQYSLDNVNFFNNLSITNLGPGRDTVYFFDANNCQVTIPFEIFEPTPLNASIVLQKDVDCAGNNTGLVNLTSSGGRSPYQFSLDGINFQPDSTFANLTAGNYTITVQDDSLCDLTLALNIIEPLPLTAAILFQRDIDCFGNSEGGFIVDANGGSPAYQFSLDSLTFQPDSAFFQLPAGNYEVTVVDDSLCVTELPITLTEPDSLVLQLVQATDIGCFGGNTGWVRLQGVGGTLPYNFTLDSLNFQTDSLFTSLTAGDYTFWVADDSSCVDSLSLSLSEPDSLELSVLTQKDIDCFANDNGLVALEGAGGVMPYLYNLDGGVFQADSIFSSLPPGTHILQIQDDSLCVNTIQVDIIEPALLEISTTHTDVRCYGFDDGTGTVLIQGGSPNYSILWDTPIPGDSATVRGLGPGMFQVTVTDDSNCVAIDFVDIFEPDTLELTVVDSAFAEAFCNWDNGTAGVDATGGIGPYTYRWDGPSQLDGAFVANLFGDTTYFATVRDQNACETTISIYIPQTPPAIPIFSSNPTYEDSILLSQANVQFINQSIGGISYVWDFGDGGLSEAENPQHLYEDTGLYPVKLTAYNSYFVCPVDTIIWLEIIPDGALYIPNAFSPNDDGQNDFFFAAGEGLIQYEMIIFSRWGQEVARLLSLSDRWDGTRNGRVVPEGVYTYRVQAILNDGARVDRGGTVTLIR